MNRRKPDPSGEIMSVVLLGMFALVFFALGIDHAGKSKGGARAFFFAGGALLLLRFLVTCRRRKMFPLSLFFSSVCRDCLIASAFGLAVHFLHGGFSLGSLLSLDGSYLMNSSLPMDQIMYVSYFGLVVPGIILVLVRPETRKKALIALLVSLVPAGALFSLVCFPALPPWIKAVGRQAGHMIWPLYCGITGALLKKRYGQKIREEYDARMKEKQEALEKARPAAPAPAPAQPHPASAARPQPRPSAPGQAKPAKAPPLPRRTREELTGAELKKLENNYLKQKENDAGARLAVPAKKLLPAAARRLYPGGRVLARLYGQRQLFLWLTALPCLKPLRDSGAAARLMSPDLPDDPDIFVPVLNDVVRKAEQLLAKKLPGDELNWSGADGETLAGVWFALRMYQRMSGDQKIFGDAAKQVARYMDKRADICVWLQQFSGEEKQE